MAISRSQLVQELEPGLNALFGLEYKNYENEHAEIYAIETSDRAFEEEVMLSGFDSAPVKTEGAGVSYDQAQEVYTARYTHETIALAFALTEEAVEDNLYASLAARYTKALARSMANTKQIKAAAILNGWDGEIRVFISTNQFIAFPDFAGNVDSVFLTTCFHTKPTMLVSRRRFRRIQTRGRGPRFTARSSFASFRGAVHALDFRYFTDLVHFYSFTYLAYSSRGTPSFLAIAT